MIAARPPVEVLRGEAADAVRGIEGDFAMLHAAGAASRVWTCEGTAVVLGVSRELGIEVDEIACARRGVAVLRRASGGGTVLIGPGTVQYAFALPHVSDAETDSITTVKQACNERVRAALRAAGVVHLLASDASGDLHVGGRKVGGVALRRHRDATLLHGSLLVDADVELMAAVLRHPAKEPAYRCGRGHVDFAMNLGIVDLDAFTAELTGSCSASHARR